MTDLSATPGTNDGDPFLVAVARAPSAPPPRELEAGAIVGHGFRIERRLGAGGMGVVYLATDLTLGREVALKVHRAHGGVDRLQREAMAMARLAHPNVITVHEIGRVEDRLFVAMEYVAGRTLRDWIKEGHSWREILAMMREVGRGLIAAHAAGLVHRDFKPENVLVGPEGRPRVGDFGLVRVVAGPPSLPGDVPPPAPDAGFAITVRVDPELVARADDPTRPGDRAGHAAVAADADRDAKTAPMAPQVEAGISSDESSAPAGPSPRRRAGPESATLLPAEISTADPDPDRLTATGAVLGTPAYMAPEQFAGEVVDARADQFAFCVALFEALYGTRPFAGRAHGEILRAIEARQIRAGTRRGPRWLRRVVERGLEANPDLRFASMAALQRAIDRGLRRRSALAIGAGVSVGAVAAVAIAVATGASTRPREPDCLAAGAEMDALWSPASRAQLRLAAARADAEVGPQIIDRLALRLDSVAAAYRGMATQACQAHDLERRWTDEDLGRTRSCLDQTLAAVRDVVASPLRTRLELGRLSTHVAQVPDPERCRDPALLASLPHPANGLVHGMVAQAALRALTELRAGSRVVAGPTGKLDRVRALAATLGDPVLDVRVGIARAGLALTRGEDAEAERLATDSYRAARSLGDDDAAVEASIVVINAQVSVRRQFTEARAWVDIVRGDLARAPARGADFHGAVATLAERDARFDEAIAERRAALDDYERRGDLGGLDYARALEQLATALDAGGASADAIPLFDKSIALIKGLVGADAPDLYSPTSNKLVALVRQRRFPEAIATGREALTLVAHWRELLPVEYVPGAYLNLGYACDASGDAIGAEASYLTARAGFQALPGDHRESLMQLDYNLASTYRKTGRLAEALQLLDRGDGLRAALAIGDSLETANTLIERAEVLAALGRCPEAVPVYARGIAMARAIAPTQGDWALGVVSEEDCLIAVGHIDQAQAALEDAHQHGQPLAPIYRAMVAGRLAELIHDRRVDPARARALLLEAEAAYREDGATDADLEAVHAALKTWP
ncbi:MAG: serine/threonine-protein kinase [Deltaproteobacteria bacterium]|nr:serine/threonine-protein kinase [Deltaproteobacteria bacterium]